MNDKMTRTVSAAEQAAADQRRLFELTVRLQQSAHELRGQVGGWCDLVSLDAEQRLGLAASERDAQLNVLMSDPAYGQALDIWRFADQAEHFLVMLRDALRTHPTRDTAGQEVPR